MLFHSSDKLTNKKTSILMIKHNTLIILIKKYYEVKKIIIFCGHYETELLILNGSAAPTKYR